MIYGHMLKFVNDMYVIPHSSHLAPKPVKFQKAYGER
jgi:hypothetical protein